ncbi:MAG: hypothetical protein KGZ58_06800 [Ignavibacteriales bacterium]|nr:hypothetical protein [Ignavibacteriales bacterium]
MSKLLNTEITIVKYKIVPSKFGGNRLDLQIKLNGELRVTWTSSEVLIGMIKDIPAEGFPFSTIIKKVNDQHYEFT